MEQSTQNTGQNVQEELGRPGMWIELARDTAGEWHWVLWSPNGRQIARNAIPYRDRQDVTEAAKKVMEAIRAAEEIEIGVTNQ